jgi:hypothetical protein
MANVYTPTTAVGDIVTFRLAAVELVTVTELTVMAPLLPNVAVVVPFTNRVFTPLTPIVSVWPWTPLVALRVIEAGRAAVTVSVTPALVNPPDAAVMLVVPAATPVAVPVPVPVIVAAAVFDDAHTTPVVNAAVVPLLYVPVAVYCCVSPAAMLAVAGVTAIDCSVAAVTVSVIPGLVNPPDAAVMLVVPAATPVATPLDPLIVAVAGTDELHTTPVVSVCVVPLL